MNVDPLTNSLQDRRSVLRNKETSKGLDGPRTDQAVTFQKEEKRIVTPSTGEAKDAERSQIVDASANKANAWTKVERRRKTKKQEQRSFKN